MTLLRQKCCHIFSITLVQYFLIRIILMTLSSIFINKTIPIQKTDIVYTFLLKKLSCSVEAKKKRYSNKKACQLQNMDIYRAQLN
uniref:Uncharacterized protein n=1 Tax=Arundo donax TaxID=35708 RepID=A0A0A8XQ74_ARUDO